MKTQIIQLHDKISRIKKEIEAELFGEDQTWNHGESNVKSPVIPTPASENPAVTAAKLNPAQLLEEYFCMRILDGALQCVEELNAPLFHPEVVKEAVSLSLEKSLPCVEPASQLIEHLYVKKVISSQNIGTGCLLYASGLDDHGIDLPKAPHNFGCIIGKLVLFSGLNFEVVKDFISKVEDDRFQKAIFDAAIGVVASYPSGQSYTRLPRLPV